MQYNHLFGQLCNSSQWTTVFPADNPWALLMKYIHNGLGNNLVILTYAISVIDSYYIECMLIVNSYFWVCILWPMSPDQKIAILLRVLVCVD